MASIKIKINYDTYLLPATAENLQLISALADAECVSEDYDYNTSRYVHVRKTASRPTFEVGNYEVLDEMPEQPVKEKAEA